MSATTESRAVNTPAQSTDSPSGLSHKQIMVVMSGLMLGMLLASLDQTIVSTALPTIVSDFKGANLYSWVVTAYLLTSTATTPLYGKISDLFGRKRIFQFAIVVFLAGSALCGLSQNMWQLIIFRGIQGLGAGGLMSLALAIVGDVIPPAQRGRYQGYFGAVFGVSSVIGPLLGGFLTENVSWRWVFYVNLPLGAIALVVINRVLKLDHVKRAAKLDWLGSLLLVGGVSLLLVGVQDSGRDATVTATDAIWLVAGALVTVAFVAWEFKAPEPVLPLRLFRNGTFRISTILSLITGAVMFGALVFIPQFLQTVKGNSATEAGLKLIPMLVGVLICSITSGRLISRAGGGYKKFVVAGTGVLTLSMVWLSFIRIDTSELEFAGMLFVVGVGLGLFMQTLVLATQNSVEMKDLGTATSGVTFFRTMGGAIGASVLGALLLAHENTGAVGILGAKGAAQLKAAGGISGSALKAVPANLADQLEHLFVNSMDYAYKFVIPACVIAFLISFGLKEVKLRTGGPAPSAKELEAQLEASISA